MLHRVAAMALMIKYLNTCIVTLSYLVLLVAEAHVVWNRLGSLADMLYQFRQAVTWGFRYF